MKFIIKESSIKEESNSRYLKLIQDELSKFVAGLQFELSLRNGNYSVCESTEFNESNYTLMSPDKLKNYINETLNFRYENFTIGIF